MSDVLVDSSAWIAFFRGDSAPEVSALDLLLDEERVCTAGIIKTEILPAAKTKREAELIAKSFHALPLAPDPVDMWKTITNWRYVLRRQGVHGVGIADLIIAAVARANDKSILALDRHFNLIAEPLGLKLFTNLLPVLPHIKRYSK